MSTIQRTCSEPTVTREATETRIEFDITYEDRTLWESIQIRRDEVGDIRIDSRSTFSGGPLWIPPVMLPLVLAELDRLASGDRETPLAAFTPVAASMHVALGDAA